MTEQEIIDQKQAHLTAARNDLNAALMFMSEEGIEKYGHMVAYTMRHAKYHWEQYNSETPEHYEIPDYSEDDNY